MQVIHYVPCECQLLDSCVCGVRTRPRPPPTPPSCGGESLPGGSSSPPPSMPKITGGKVIVPDDDDEEEDSTDSCSSLSSISLENEPSKFHKIYKEVRKTGLKVSFFLANFQFTAFTATLTSQWHLSLLVAVVITNVQHALKSLLLILFAWPAKIYLGKNFTRTFSVISYISGLIIMYVTYPSQGIDLGLGLLLVTFGQCTSYVADTDTEFDVDFADMASEEAYDPQESVSYYFHIIISTIIEWRDILWDMLKRNWIKVLGLFVAVFLIPGQRNGLRIMIWILSASFGFNLLGQLCIKVRDRGIGGTFGRNVLRKALSHKLSNGQQKWTKFRSVWGELDKKQLLRTLRLSMVFLPYIMMSEIASNFFFQQVEEMNSVHIFGKNIPTQAFKLLAQFLVEIVHILSHWLNTKLDDAPRTRFYGTLRVGLAMLITIPCFVTASVVETKRWEENKNSVAQIVPQIILMVLVDGLANDGIGCFFKKELDYSIQEYGFLFEEGIKFLGKMLCVVWNVFWENVTSTNGNQSWLGERGDNRHRLDRYYSMMAIFADVSCIVYVHVAYRYSIKCHKRRC